MEEILIYFLNFENVICSLKVALSQKILENFYIADINIPYDYPEQKS